MLVPASFGLSCDVLSPDCNDGGKQGSTDAYVLRNAAQGARLEWPSQQETGFFCHEDLRALVERCWDHDPERRPTMKVRVCCCW